LDEPELELNESDTDEDDADESEKEQATCPRLTSNRHSQVTVLIMFSPLYLLE
jgi:hypothetical protein